MEQGMHWAEAWLRTTSAGWRPRLRRALGHRQRANIISEQAVWIGVTATLGLAAAVAFVTGIGQILAKELQHIGAQVP
jgi:hypothetical protein